MVYEDKYRQNWLTRALQREIAIIVPLRALALILFGSLTIIHHQDRCLELLLLWAATIPLHYYLAKKSTTGNITLIAQIFIACDSLVITLVATVLHQLVSMALLFIPIAILRSVFSGINPRMYWLQGIPGTVMIVVLGHSAQISLHEVLMEVLVFWVICWLVIRLAREYQEMIEKISRDSERLRHLALTDSLTGLANHRYFLEQADKAIKQGRRFAVVFLDVDDFKKFNETCGHLKGDRVLTQVSSQIRQTVRSTDLVARYGGEEFLVLAPDLDIAEVQMMADRLRESVAANCGVTMSIGIALYPEHGQTAEAIISAADMAMYYSKRSGKNRVSYLEDLMDFLFCADLEPNVGRAVSPLLTWLHYRHPETVEHARGVKRLVQQYAAWSGLTKDQTDLLVKASLVHDLGKGDIPREILDKRDPLTDEEWILIKQHPALGVAGISEVSLLQDTIEIVRHHHENWDGSGYPDGLREEQIPELARIMAVADAYEAMTRCKTYRPAFCSEEALAQLEAEAGRHFDPEIVRDFIRFIQEAEGVAC